MTATRAIGARARHRGLYWIAVLLALVAMAAGTVVAYLGYTAASGPDGVVRAYFAALQRGDAAGALAFGALPDGPHTLLTAAVLREQRALGPITGVQVGAVQDGADHTATVTVHYDIAYPAGTQQVIDQVPVVERGATWYLTRTAVATRIDLTHALDRATIAGAAVPAGDTLLFPGAVPIRFDTPYLRVSSGAATFGTGDELQVGVTVTAAGRAAVTGALRSALDACLAHGGSGYCPLPSDRYVPGSLTGRLVGKLDGDLTLTVDPDSAGVIDVGGSVGFRGSYRTLRFDNSPTGRTGTVQIPLTAKAYAVRPIVIRWADPS